MKMKALTALLCLLMMGGLFAPSSFAQEATNETETAAPAETEAPAEETPADDEEAPAEEEAPAYSTYDEIPEGISTRYAIDNLFLFICAVLVLFMQGGFSMVESGFNSSKNTVNVLFKNVMDLCVGVLLYWVVGYGLMYPGDGNGYLAFGQVGAPETVEASSVAPGGLSPQVDFLFQVAFAATAATIVSGAVAGRMKFSAYLVYSAVLTGIIYPISGYWKWGGGWLDAMGFYDFAGSLVVHACGGFAGLAGAIVLGPRLGRFAEDGTPKAIPGHNLGFATLGVIILWVGWYGFNPGSQLVFSDASNANTTMLIATNTTLAAAAGGLSAMLVAWALFKKPDLSMALNGVLGGLVGITANCDSVTNVEGIIIGAVAGALVVAGVMLLDKLKIDDPVGAWPVHGLAGVWGGLATGIFGGHDMVAQITGSIAIPVWAFVTMFILFSILKGAGMLRVSPEEESVGLDISEHGMQAYGA
ncbi:MAG: ammonium transporter [Planctomycetaceae bacterium]|nr:ammonium transporter [Planctomycetaceae bacterium]